MSKSIAWSIERDGPDVLIAGRDEDGQAVTIRVHKNGAAALSSVLHHASAEDADDHTYSLSTRGELDVPRVH